MKVCLGVVDMPYDYGDNPGATTHEVALSLENDYQLFSHFWEKHQDVIVSEVGETVAWQIINHIQHGAPLVGGEQLGDTMKAFSDFLNQEEMAGLTINGNSIPTKAALEGVNSRLKDKYTGIRRPSFIDGGLFKSSFVAWIDNDAEP